MERYIKLSSTGKTKVIKNDWFHIEGQEFKLAELQFDPYTLQHHSLGFENSDILTLPPHMMMILGEALMEAAQSEFNNLEAKFRREAEILLKKT